MVRKVSMLSIYSLFIHVGPILMDNKHLSSNQNSISTYENKIILLSFHAVVLLKTFPIMYHSLLFL